MNDFKITERITPRSDIATRYFNDVNKVPTHDKYDETVVAVKAATGDIESRDKLVTSNLRFVVSVAKMYYSGSDHTFEDLINEGNMGLIEAADTFDPTLGFKFISHAIWYIRKNMFKYLTDNSRHVRLPQSMTNSVKEMKALESELEQSLERDVSKSEVIDMYIEQKKEEGSTPRRKYLESAMYADNKSSSIDSCIPGSETLTLLDVLDGNHSPSDALVDGQDDNIKLITLYVNRLRMSDRDIINKKTGLDGSTPMSSGAIAELYEVSAEAIRVRFKTAIRRLYRQLRSDNMGLSDFT